MVKYFLFLKLVDPEICSVLWDLRDIFFNEKKKRSSIHVTVRGPNKEPFKGAVIDKLYEKIADDAILIHSVDRFQNGKQHVVYLKVQGENLHKIWRKPDYPRETYGINAHITLYEGSDKERADCVYDFLKQEHLELACYKFELVPYQSKQSDMLSQDLDLVGSGFMNLVDRGKVSINVLERAKLAMDECGCKQLHAGNDGHAGHAQLSLKF
jgi:hypothetical protein